MVARTDPSLKERLFDLMAEVMDLVREGKRDAGAVAGVLQVVKDDRSFVERLFPALSATATTEESVEAKLEEWRTLYREVFSIELDTVNLRIPERKPGWNWLIVVAGGLTPNKIFGAMQEFCGAWRYTDDLDTVTSSVRKTDKTYAVWVRDRVEADDELKMKSAKDLEREGVNTITLEERMLLEIWNYRKTKKYLDIRTWTLCAGSRHSDGSVPYVLWFAEDGEVNVDWTLPERRDDFLRARQAVS